MTTTPWALLVSCVWAAAGFVDEPPAPLAMTKPVVCRDIHGLASFEPLPDATLTADDKLTIYYEPSGHAVEKTAKGFRSVLAQDGRLRKKGGKDALWKKEGMFQYEAKGEYPPVRLFMRTDMSLKGLPPGDYEIDLTLVDKLAPKERKVMRTVEFKVVPPGPEPKKPPEVATESRPPG